jgi:NADPH:quinone reductase-like Zn-dependent oxidoreductase
MKAAIIEKQGSPVAPNIRFVEDWPEPDPPAHGEVLVRTLASALNHMDIWVGMGVPGLDSAYPRVSGCDACGIVESVGEDVDPAWVGRRVIVNAAVRQRDRVSPDDPPGSTLAPLYRLIGEHSHGMHREKFVAPVANLAVINEENDLDEAAAFGLCALTAFSQMVTKARLKPGQAVLVTGIGGGVATASLRIAKHLGCPTAVTSRHQWKLDKAAELGADLGILDDGSDWSKQIRAWTNKRGVDLAVDSTGEATHLNCIKSLCRGGTYVTPGCTSGHHATTDLRRIFWLQLKLLGSTMGTNEEFAEVASLFRAGLLRPVVDRVFPAEQASKAWARLEAAEQFGKIVLRW